MSVYIDCMMVVRREDFFRFLIDVDPDVDPEMNRHYEARNRQCLSEVVRA